MQQAHDLAYTHVNSLSIQADNPGTGAVQVTNIGAIELTITCKQCDLLRWLLCEHNATERPSPVSTGRQFADSRRFP